MLWTGKMSQTHVKTSVDATSIAQTVLSRKQLIDVFRFLKSNGQVSLECLTAFVLLNEHDYMSEPLQKMFQIDPPAEISLSQEANFARMSREDIEAMVLQFHLYK